MKPSSLLLRVLLSAVLILNGIGSAVAGVQMVGAEEVMPAATAADAGTTAAEPSQGACHEDATAIAPDGAAPPGGTGHGEHGADCCQAGMCACHCMQQAQVAFVPPVLASRQFAHSVAVHEMSSAHETPRLPNLIRPPIRHAS